MERADPAGGTPPEATARIARLLTRADEVRKAAPVRRDAEVVRGQLAELLAAELHNRGAATGRALTRGGLAQLALEALESLT